jgi:hypothetical protein
VRGRLVSFSRRPTGSRLPTGKKISRAERSVHALAVLKAGDVATARELAEAALIT